MKRAIAILTILVSLNGWMHGTSFFSSVDSMEREMDNFYLRVKGMFNKKNLTNVPDKDIYEKDGNLIIEMDVAGMKPENISISVEGRRLTVIGKQKEKKEEKDKDYYLKEVRSGSFEMSMILPVEVNVSKSEAKVENGHLRITIPKQEEPKAKKIQVDVK